MIRIGVPFCNAGPFVERCIRTIRSQTVRDWRCYVYDDCSTDDSVERARRAIDTDDRFQVASNTRKMWQAGNWWQMAQRPEVDDDDVLVTIDGDDWLPDRDVFRRVLHAYARDRVWLTYGNFGYAVNGRIVAAGYCRPLRTASRIREAVWVTSHLKTFKAFLFRRIRRQDLVDETGGFLRAAADMAVMFPMVEMAGNDRIRAFTRINYAYNVSNPRNVYRTRAALQHRIERMLRQRGRYRRLP